MNHLVPSSKSYLIIIVSLLTIPFQVLSQTHIWTGSGDGISWNDDNNWNQNAEPDAGDEVFIANDSVVVFTGQDAAWVQLENAQFTIVGTLQLNNGDTFGINGINSKIYNLGRLIIEEAGQNEFGDRAIQLLAGSSFQNDSTCLILESGGSGVRLEGSSTYINNGYLSMVCDRQGIQSTSFSNFINNDSVVVDAASSGIWNSSGGIFINNNFVTLQTSNAIAALRASSGGLIDNYGRILVNTIDSDSAILCSGTGSIFNHFSGMIVCTSTGASSLVRCRINAIFTISTGAVLDVSGAASTNLLDIENDCTVTWDGIVTISN